MKIKLKKKSYSEVISLPKQKHQKPKKQNPVFRFILNVFSRFELAAVKFKCNKINIDKLPKGQPVLYLMNHSSFIDLEITSVLLAGSPYHIVCTSDAFVGKNWLMRQLGCIPTRKFQTDISLLKDMAYVSKDLKSSILMFPEASYSFDGTATPLPNSLGKCLKFLGMPVVMIKTYGAFTRDPLYNNLKKRKVKVSADMEYILTPEQIKEKSAEELNEILKNNFTFDSFKWQQENKIKVPEKFRADYLHRVLYKCPNCKTEGKTVGKGVSLTCTSCGKRYILDEYGYMKAEAGETEFAHIPDWFNWQRNEVKKELENGTYRIDISVDIGMMVDYKSIYKVGSGNLTHDINGFHLTGCDGELDFKQHPGASYSLYSDYYWYETSDIICVGDSSALYYCFLNNDSNVSAKARIAAEELYIMTVACKNI